MNNPADSAQPVEYVGFGPRFLVFIIDSMVVLPLLGFFIYGFYQADGSNWMQILWASRDNALLHYGLPALFFITFWISKSATPGKIATKMIIVDAETLQKPDPIRLIVRYIGYYVSLLPLGLGFLWILWDPKKQGWHDKMAKTVVIRERPEHHHQS